MSTRRGHEVQAAVIGAGVVGCAVALGLARRGVSTALIEAEPEPALAASGTNSGIVHTGFDSVPGTLETQLILRSAGLRAELLAALEVPLLRCGARMRPQAPGDRDAIAALARNAARNGVAATVERDGTLVVPGESVTDPVAYTLAICAAAQRHGAQLRTGQRVAAIERAMPGLSLTCETGERWDCQVAINCAGLWADRVASLGGDRSFEIYPRKGEFVVFDQPAAERLETVLLPVPTQRTKGVLVFPTLDGKVVAGPTAVDQADKHDWSVRPVAAAEIMAKAVAIYPPLKAVQPVAAYAGLRTAGCGLNYLIAGSDACPGLVNVAAIRSTGLSASLGIAEHAIGIVASLGVKLGPVRPLSRGRAPAADGPWWLRTAAFRESRDGAPPAPGRA